MTLDFTRNYVLEDERVLLRPLVEEDFPHLEKFSIQEPDLWKFSLQSAAGERQLKEFIQFALQCKAQRTQYPFIIFDKQTNEYAGSTRFYEINLLNKTLFVGYTFYGKVFQGSGLNKHVKLVLLEFCFEGLGMERAEFRADSRNLRSIAAMKSIGCTVEGVLRSTMPTKDGGRRDSVVLSILKQEWLNGSKAQLEEKIKNRF